MFKRSDIRDRYPRRGKIGTALWDEPQTIRVVRFGTFELDLAAGELRKKGLKVRLQDQPFQLLAALAARPGEVVTREELKDKLWPSDRGSLQQHGHRGLRVTA